MLSAGLCRLIWYLISRTGKSPLKDNIITFPKNSKKAKNTKIENKVKLNKQTFSGINIPNENTYEDYKKKEKKENKSESLFNSENDENEENENKEEILEMLIYNKNQIEDEIKNVKKNKIFLI